ncbi:MarR family transcriptional regulator [Luteibacter anthropi]|uniref:MarR family transcriptional regulator n=1 Tax=Luteibacter anthropi TaxID=564369 RepID=A0A7X5UD41_9GAMM|nr:MarR family transcriptional regulator [Luteibacter anthropi]NII08294.1 MarR family transcriptional regulator [Luteibacter anthropi]URX64369.1 MarR family transcriptional regulator [Luteibacter anthropi]
MKPRDKLYMRLTTLVPATSRRWMRLVDLRLGDMDITSASVVPLIFISRSKGGINQVTLAEQVGVVGPTLVRTLDKLVELGLVVRENDPDDRRAKTLWLTERGQELADVLEARLIAVRREVFDRLPPEDIEAAVRVLQTLEDVVGGERDDADS